MKILTMNLNYYISKHGPWEARKELIREAIASVSPDLAALQAVAREPEVDGCVDQATQLADLLPGYTAVYQPVASDGSGKAEGMAFLSRHPVRSIRVRPLTFRSGLEDTNRRMLVGGSFLVDGLAVNLVNAHFSWVGEQAADNIQEAIPFLRGFAGPTVLAGDFNTRPQSSLLDPLREEGWKDAWAALHADQEGSTFESNQPSIRIDYIWTSGALSSKLKEITIVADQAAPGGLHASNHFGLVAEF